MDYQVKKIFNVSTVNAGWDMAPWDKLPFLRIGNHMGNKPVHFPNAEVKLGYDDASVHVMFRVSDRYVRAVAADHQDNVFEDSCVEFFFTPGEDISQGYFNLEMNCGGTMLFHFQTEKGKDRVVIPKDACRQIICTHTLPSRVDPELSGPVIWTVAYRLPLALLKRFSPVVMPGPGVQWRANFYKCGDKTSHPHWLTWSPVDFPTPNFHLPRFFGILEFK